MRHHLLAPIAQYAIDLRRSSGQAWDTFWFSPSNPTLLGLLRILTGLMLLYTHFVWGLVLDEFFGATPWLSAELVQTMQADQFAYSFWWLVSPEYAWLVHSASMMVLALFTVGLATPITSVMSLVVAISYAHRVPEALFGLDQINVMLTLYLTIGGAGQAVSIDRWLFRRGKMPQPSIRANIGRRLIQVHMCIIYFFAGISKLQGGSWWDGTAMWRAFANYEYQTMDMTWLAQYPQVLNLMTHTTILWEISFCVLVWNRLWRPIVLALGVAMHVGIGACLGMWTFGLIMLVGCASFLPPSLGRHHRKSVVENEHHINLKQVSSVEAHTALVPAGPHIKIRNALRNSQNGPPVRVDYGYNKQY